MRHVVACTTLVCLPAAALAEPIGSLDLGTTFVSGPATSGAWNPRLRVGLGAVAGAQVDDTDFRLSWGVFRDQAFCDTCEGGEGPGNVGRELLGSTDLTGSVGRSFTFGDVTVRFAGDLVLPASRDALACNPFYGAPGASATVRVPVSSSAVRVSGRASRPVFRYDAVPVGLCSPELEGGPISTLSGPVEPTPWGGARPGLSNPTAMAGLAVAWLDPHALAFASERLTTSVSLGLDASRSARADETWVDTVSGPVLVEEGRAPFVAAFPWSVSAGFAASDRLNLSLMVSDRVPTLLADPGGTLRAMPGRAALSFTVSGHL